MIIGRTVTVGTTAVDLLAGLGVEGEYALKLRLGSSQFWFGDSTVAVGNGFTVSGPMLEEFRFQSGDRLYAITAASASTIDVLAYSI